MLYVLMNVCKHTDLLFSAMNFVLIMWCNCGKQIIDHSELILSLIVLVVIKEIAMLLGQMIIIIFVLFLLQVKTWL